MSQVEFENPFENVESKLIDALGEFDKERGELYDSLTQIGLEAPDVMEYQIAIGEKVSAVAMAMQDLAYELLKADGVDASKEQLTRLWQADDNERVGIFTQLIECENECFESMDEASAEYLVDELYGSVDTENELSEEIFEKYRMFLASDVHEFAEHVQKKHELQKRKTAPREVKTIMLDINTARKAARGMAAVAFGVLTGMAIERFARKEIK